MNALGLPKVETGRAKVVVTSPFRPLTFQPPDEKLLTMTRRLPFVLANIPIYICLQSTSAGELWERNPAKDAKIEARR